MLLLLYDAYYDVAYDIVSIYKYILVTSKKHSMIFVM
jgi:hypothetical protein